MAVHRSGDRERSPERPHRRDPRRRARPAIPRVPVLARTELVARLEDATERPLTLLIAPAGFGKTTLLKAWEHRRERHRVLVTTRDARGSAEQLVARIRTELEWATGVLLDESFRALHAGADLVDDVLPTLARELGERLLEPVTLAIDGDREEPGSPVAPVVGRLAELAPPTLRLVVAGRAGSPLPTARLRLRGMVAELGREDLRFDQREAERLLAGFLGRTRAAQVAAAVHQRTEGWPAAVALAGQALRAHPRPSAQAARRLDGTHPLMVEYLEQELLVGVAPETRRALRALAVVGPVTPPLAAAVTEGVATPARLDSARAAGLLVPVAEPGVGLRVPALLADLLTAELDAIDPAEARRALGRASSWFAVREMPLEAVSHAVAAGDVTTALELLERDWPRIVAQGGAWGLLPILERLRDVDAPVVAALRAGTDLLLWGDLDAARRLAELHGGPPAVEEIREWVLLAPIAGDVGRALSNASHAVARSHHDPALAILVGVHHAQALSAAGDGRAALDALPDEEQLRPFPALRGWWLAARSVFAAQEGFHADALVAGREALAIADRVGARAGGQLRVPASCGLMWALRELGQIDQAREVQLRIAAYTRRLPGTVYRAMALAAMAANDLVEQEPEQARTALAEARAVTDDCPDTGFLGLAIAERERTARRDVGDAASPPSPAEMRVLEALQEDGSLREIAERLYLSRDTVKTHVRSIYRRLGVHDRPGAVAEARRRGLLPDPLSAAAACGPGS